MQRALLTAFLSVFLTSLAHATDGEILSCNGFGYAKLRIAREGAEIHVTMYQYEGLDIIRDSQLFPGEKIETADFFLKASNCQSLLGEPRLIGCSDADRTARFFVTRNGKQEPLGFGALNFDTGHRRDVGVSATLDSETFRLFLAVGKASSQSMAFRVSSCTSQMPTSNRVVCTSATPARTLTVTTDARWTNLTLESAAGHTIANQMGLLDVAKTKKVALKIYRNACRTLPGTAADLRCENYSHGLSEIEFSGDGAKVVVDPSHVVFSLGNNDASLAVETLATIAGEPARAGRENFHFDTCTPTP